jgi:hypothetical protein
MPAACSQPNAQHAEGRKLLYVSAFAGAHHDTACTAVSKCMCMACASHLVAHVAQMPIKNNMLCFGFQACYVYLFTGVLMPPTATKQPKELVTHNDIRTDDYYWWEQAVP